MIAAFWLIAAAAGAAQADPAGGATPTLEVHKLVREGEMAKADAEAYIAKCGLRKFETEASSNYNGKLRKAKILLCAKAGESDAEWIATLEKAASKVVATTELSMDAKAKIAGDLQAEIARLRAAH
jgi:hypothetical protein